LKPNPTHLLLPFAAPARSDERQRSLPPQMPHRDGRRTLTGLARAFSAAVLVAGLLGINAGSVLALGNALP
jgi:hypothetical protein